MVQRVQYGRLIDQRLDEVLATTRSGERIGSIVTETVPSRLPGELLVCVSDLAPRTVETEPIVEAAVAVNLAWLHQYLHSIAVVTDSLREPVVGSPYDGDTVAAILDGDVLQSLAFEGVSHALASQSAAAEGYERLSRASQESYERLSTASGASPKTFAPISGAAARFGAIIGGADRDACDRIEAAARSLAQRVTVSTPTGIRRERALGATDEPIETIADALEVPSKALDQLRTVFERANRQVEVNES